MYSAAHRAGARARISADDLGPPERLLLGVGLDDFFRFAEPLPNGEPNELWELPSEKVQRLKELGQRNNEGRLSVEERPELADLVAEYETVALHNAKVRLWRAGWLSRPAN